MTCSSCGIEMHFGPGCEVTERCVTCTAVNAKPMRSRIYRRSDGAIVDEIDRLEKRRHLYFPPSMHSRVYKLACGTTVDEIVNDDGVVIAKTMTPPPSETPMGAEEWAKAMVDAGGGAPAPDHVWNFVEASGDLPLDTGLHFEAGDSLCYQHHITGWSRKASDPDPIQAADVDHFEQHHDRRLVAVMKNGERLDLGFDPDMPKDWGMPEAMPTDQLIDPTTATFTSLDVQHDGVTLRELLRRDEHDRREIYDGPDFFTAPYRYSTSQRAAISAHWSAELRQRVEAAKEKQRTQVVVEGDEE